MDKELLRGKKIVVFGAGAQGKMVVSRHDLRIDFLVDNSREKQGGFVEQYPVMAPNALETVDREETFVVIASEYYSDEIAAQLQKMGFIPGEQFADYREIYEDVLSEGYPVTMTLSITTRCNSKCVMCGVSRREFHETMDLDDLLETIKLPMFGNVRSVIISGGEPTVLPDLEDYIRGIVSILGRLENMTICSNTLLTGRSLELCQAIGPWLSERGIRLKWAASVDGLYEIYDRQRGVPGGFVKVCETLEALRKIGVEISITTTITSINVWQLEETLHFFKKLDYPFFMRLCRVFERFNNVEDDESRRISMFDEDERYQLMLLFHKLLLDKTLPTTSFQQNVAYLNLNRIQAVPRPRNEIVSCGYHCGKVAALYSGSRIYSCSKFADLFVPVNWRTLPQQAVWDKMRQRADLIEQYGCDECTEELDLSLQPAFIKQLEREAWWQKFFTLDYYNTHMAEALPILCAYPNEEESPYVLITGWYGTETVGDKAILGEILETARKRYPNRRMKITSMYPFVTQRTLYELNESAEVIPVFGNQALFEATGAEAVVMGGGPLMDLECLALPLWLFQIAKKMGGRTIIQGCGIGPLHGEKFVQGAAELLKLADEISLRDAPSVAWAHENAGIDAALTEDPAIAYLRGHFPNKKAGKSGGVLACFLRELPAEYFGELSCEAFLKFRQDFEAALAQNIKHVCKRFGLKPHFYAMHNFVVGNDDRDFNFRFADTYFEPGSYEVDPKLCSIEKNLDLMCAAEKVICMRFHSSVFADYVEADYIPIDYTSGGKVAAFAASRGKTAASLDDLQKEAGCLARLFAAKADLRP